MNDEKRFEQLKKWSAKQNAYRENPELNVIDLTPRPFRFQWKYQMKIGQRIDLFLWSMVMLLIGSVALIISCFAAYILIVSLFS